MYFKPWGFDSPRLFYYICIMEGRITPEKINELDKYQIFVFGSNLAGVHGAGAAKLAYDKMWTKHGVGYGSYIDGKTMSGSFAIPTKGLDIEVLPLNWIEYYVKHFIKHAAARDMLTYLVTEIGCGLAGYTPEQIAPMFKEAVKYENIHLPQRFWDVLNKENNKS